MKILMLGLVALTAALTSACATTGVGSGATRSGASAVAFTWHSDDGVTGNMTGTLAATGELFSGQYFQVTSNTRVDDLGPLWVGWGRRSGGWPYWGPNDRSAFVTNYSGRVLANLAGANGQHMRCSFQLIHPSSGMAGGGAGRCQMPDGKSIDTTFPTQ